MRFKTQRLVSLSLSIVLMSAVGCAHNPMKSQSQPQPSSDSQANDAVDDNLATKPMQTEQQKRIHDFDQAMVTLDMSEFAERGF